MADNEQRSGIVYYFGLENENIARRFEQYVARNNKLLSQQEHAMRAAAKTAQKSMKDTSDAVEDAANKTEKSGRKFIQSISGIYAAFVLAPKVAQEFGEALKEGATGKDVRDSFQNLADSVGVSADQLLSSMKEAARGTVTEIELMRQANRAFIAGGAEFALAIPQLFEIARAAAVATGQDVTFVLDSLTKGIAKASIKLIDNAEVYIKVGEAVEEYAEKLGVTADELDVTSRRQAILQAVLEQGSGLIDDTGTEAENAADQFRKYETAVLDAKQATTEFFVDLVGPGAAGQVKALSDVVVGLSGVLQTLALLKIAGGGAIITSLLGTGGLAAGATKLAAILPAVVSHLAAFAGGAFVVDRILQGLAYGPLEEVTGIKLPSFGKQLELVRLRLFEGQGAMMEYYREINKLGEFSDVTKEAQARAREELERMLDTMVGGEDDYRRYIMLVRELNSELEEGEEAIAAWSQAVFTAQQMLRGAVSGMADELEEQRRKLELLEERQALAADARKDVNKARENIKRILERTRDLIEDYNRNIEKEMRRHQFRINEILIDSAQDREDAIRNYGGDIAGAEKDYQREVEDAHRQHRFNLEDIERRYQRRMQSIREKFERTVVKAARRRDVLAIINAREQRQIEEREASRDRDDALFSENRSYQEQLRQAQEAYRDRVEEAKRGLEEELREIDIALQRRLDKEKRAHEERLREMEIAHQQRMADLERDLDEEFDLIRIKRNQIQAWLDAHPIQFRVGPAPKPGRFGEVTGDTGFSGIVEGPTNFKVGPGITEYIYASGPLGGSGPREAPAPSAAATSSMALQHSIKGGLNVGMSGLSSQVLSGLGPQLQESIGQAIVDSITAGILGSL